MPLTLQAGLQFVVNDCNFTVSMYHIKKSNQ